MTKPRMPPDPVGWLLDLVYDLICRLLPGKLGIIIGVGVAATFSVAFMYVMNYEAIWRLLRLF